VSDKNYKSKLSKFLLTYRKTPDSASALAPAEIMFVRKLLTGYQSSQVTLTFEMKTKNINWDIKTMPIPPLYKISINATKDASSQIRFCVRSFPLKSEEDKRFYGNCEI
jgi:hypothetical protein